MLVSGIHQSDSVIHICFCSVTQSCATPWTAALRVPCPSLSRSLPKLMPFESVMPSNHLILRHPLPSCLQSSPASGSFLMSRLFASGAKVLALQLQHQSFQWIVKVDFLWDWLVWSPCSPRDSQESSPTLQFKTINSLRLSLLYGPTLTSIHDYWKNHSFDKMDLC